MLFCRYEEAREEEKLRSQREDFSDMVAEVLIYSFITSFSVVSNSAVTCFRDGLLFFFLQNAKKRKRKMQEKDSKSKKKDFKF